MDSGMRSLKKFLFVSGVMFLLLTGCSNFLPTEEEILFYLSLINMTEPEVTELLGTPDSVETDSGNLLAKDYKGYIIYTYSRPFGKTSDAQILVGVREGITDLVRVTIPIEEQKEIDTQKLAARVENQKSVEMIMYSDDQSFMIEFVSAR